MIKRGTFVGMAAAAAGAGMAAASAQSERITIHGSGGDAIPAYSALPKAMGANTPGIVIVMHIWGVDTSMRQTADMLAGHGFAVAVPDLYGRWNPPTGDGATDYKVFQPFAQRLDAKQVEGDLAGGAQYLRAQKAGKIALLGFCMGGGIVLNRMTDKTYDAGAVFYGKIPETDPKSISTPIVGSYGEEDTGIPADGVRTFYDALAGPHDLKIYDGAGHAFCDTTRSSYRAAQARDAWDRAIAFLDKYLRA